MNWFLNEHILIKVFVGLVFISTLLVVVVKHYNRMAFVESEQIQKEKDALQADWSRMQIENSTLLMHGRIEKLAREQLDMVYPDKEITVLVK